MGRRIREDYEDDEVDALPEVASIQPDAEIEKILNNVALKSIQNFFHNKKWYCGGPIPAKELQSESSIKTVRFTSIARGFDYAHEKLLPRIPKPADYKDTTMTWENHYAVTLLHSIHEFGIPKEHVPGLVLLFFKFCKGFPIPDPPDYLME